MEKGILIVGDNIASSVAKMLLNREYGKYALLKAEKHDVKVTNEILSFRKTEKLLIDELYACRGNHTFTEYEKGIEMALIIISNLPHSHDRIAKFYVVQTLKEFTQKCKNLGLVNLIVGMTHCWLLIDHMEGEQ